MSQLYRWKQFFCYSLAAWMLTLSLMPNAGWAYLPDPPQPPAGPSPGMPPGGGGGDGVPGGGGSGGSGTPGGGGGQGGDGGPNDGMGCFLTYKPGQSTGCGRTSGSWSIVCPPPPPPATPDPIFLRHGTAIENVVDLLVPGPMDDWKLARSYNSDSKVRADATDQGHGWYNDQSELRLVPRDLQHTQIAFVREASSQLVFELVAGDYVPPNAAPNYRLTRNVSAQEFRMSDRFTGEVWIFYDFSTVHGVKRGRLKEQTNRFWEGAGKIGYVYAYDGSGRVNQITTPEGQEYNIVFTRVSGRITSVEVLDGSTVIAKAEYVYFTSGVHSTDVGRTGDLVQVKVSRLTSDEADYITEYTQYRYDNASRLTGIYKHDGIFSLIADNGSINTPDNILTRASNYSTSSTGGHPVSAFASRLYTYYTSNQSTASVNTAFASGENLETKYGGSNVDESGMIKVGIDRPDGCATCSGGGGGGAGATGVSYEYYYMSINHGSTPDENDVVWLAIEDVKDSDGVNVKRTIWGLNDAGNLLREAVIENPVPGVGTTTKYWCTSRIYDPSHPGRHSEQRQPSAHTAVVSDALLAKFLNPTVPSNDDESLNPTDGVVIVFEYDNLHRPIARKIKKGRTGAANYVNYAEYDAEATDKPKKMWEYPTPVSTNPAANGYFYEYNYTFWDGSAGRRPKTIEILSPVVDTSENGSGVRASYWEYYDAEGRLRWTKNGEGYVNYYSYNPSTGGLAYMAVDVDTSSLGAEITSGDNSGPSGADVLWEPWAESLPTELQRAGGLPSALKLVSKSEFDAQGRLVKSVDASGKAHCIAHGSHQSIQFPYWDGSKSLLPIQVAVANAAHQVEQSYQVSAAFTGIATLNGRPVGFSSAPSQSDYVSWTTYAYNPLTGERTRIDRYHKIPGSGFGAPETNFNSTHLLYDAMGRQGGAAQYVESGKYQVTATLFDKMGRRIETRRGVNGSVPTYASVSDSSLPGWLKSAGSTVYDNGGAGDGYVTQTKKVHSTDGSTYTLVNLHRTFRGHVRGIERQYANGGSPADVTPYRAMDVDWQGRTTASAQYTTVPGWSTLKSSYDVWVNDSAGATGRFDRTVAMHDALGRVYRSEHYPGLSANKLQTNNYYDRNDRLVCTGDKYSAHTEYAYDGAGRQYQQRTVADVKSTPYSSGAFVYRSPGPVPTLSSTSGMGDDGVVELTHQEFDAAGNVIGSHTLELHHSDANGIDYDADSYVRRSVYSWYDPADRLVATADYGSGDSTSGAGSWKYVNSVPTRPANPPTWTDSAIYDGLALLTTYDYDAATGRQDLVASGVKKNGSNTDKMATKTFYDDLGRRTYVAENFVDFAPSSSPTSPTGVGGGSNNDQDRVTGWQYDGLGNVLKLTAYNLTGSTDDQVTEYVFGNDYHANLVTKTIYPDVDSTNDNVRRTYNLDGSLATMTDQRGVVHAYSYDNRRQLVLDAVTSLGSSGAVDDSIRSIKRTYDARGRLLEVQSCSDAAGTTVLNRIYHFYQDGGTNSGRPVGTRQYHDATSYQDVLTGIDGGELGGVFVNQLRQAWLEYPNGMRIGYERGHTSVFGNIDNIDDRLGRITGIDVDLDGAGSGHAWTDEVKYQYNGTNRLVSVDDVVPDVRRRMFNATTHTNYDAFDRFGRTVRQQWDKYVVSPASSTPIDQFDYEYDYAGNRLSRDIPATLYAGNDRDQVYTYDGLQRLWTMHEGALSGTSIPLAHTIDAWQLDALGNWLSYTREPVGSPFLIESVRAHNLANEITDIDEQASDQWQNPAHDAAGNMTVIPTPNDPTMPYVLRYDAWNRLVAIFTPDISEQDPKIRMDYDGLHRRIVKWTDNGTLDGIFDEIRHYYYAEDWQVVEERLETGGTINANPINQYVWHPQYVDALAMRRYDANSNGSVADSGDGDYYYLQDANYNVTAVTNASGAVVERYAYTPYGEVTILNGASDADGAVADWSVDANQVSDIGNVYLYTGRERDPETGLQNSRYRFYASHLGRWLSRDPIGYATGMNLYEYVQGSPLSLMDPWGLYGCPPSAQDLSSGVAIPIGDVDGDGKMDYRFKDPSLNNHGYTSYCTSSGGGMFYVVAPGGYLVHRCPYVGGQNDFSVNPDTGAYNGRVRNPANKETTCYRFMPRIPGRNDMPHLTIDVHNDPTKHADRTCYFRGKEIPRRPSELPMPADVPPRSP